MNHRLTKVWVRCDNDAGGGMRVDLDKLELKHASSIHRGTGVAVVNEDDLASIIAELCAAREVVVEARQTARFMGEDYPEYTEPLNEKLDAYDAATKAETCE